MSRPSSLRRAALAALVIALGPIAACTAPTPEPRASSSTGAQPAKELPPDTVVTTKEKIRGQIIRMTPTSVTLREEDGSIRELAKGIITDIKYGSDESFNRWNSAPLTRFEAPASSSNSSSWFPTSNLNRGGASELIDWFAGHEPTQCTGPFLASQKQHEDFRLFVPPGGRVVFYDRRNLGYHAHLFPNGYVKPVDRPELTIPFPEKEGELPEGILFVSSAVQTTANDGAKDHRAYTMSDLMYTRIHSLASQDAVLAVQPWGGGRPTNGVNGPIWCLALPKNDHEWYLYVADNAQHTHAKLLRTSWAMYGDFVLDANNIVEVQSPDKESMTLGRVFVLPYPDPVNPNSDPVITLYGGTANQPTAIATLTAPPRYTTVLPPKAPSTKADVWLHFSDVSAEIPERFIVGYGTGIPTGRDVKVSDDPLDAKIPDQKITIDLSARSDEEFPAVAWLAVKRLRLWKTPGGRFAPGAPLAEVPPAPPQTPRRVISSPPVAHVLPILFLGKAVPQATARGMDPAANLGTGMTSALANDALARQLASGAPSMVSNLSSPSLGGGGGQYSNTTNVQIVMPPPTPGLGAATPAMGGGGSPTGWYAPSSMNTGGVDPYANNPFAPMNYGGYGNNAGNLVNRQGQKIWSPDNPGQSYSSAQQGGATITGFDPNNHDPIIGFPKRRNTP